TAPEPVLKVVLDKFKLVCVLDGIIPVPATHLLGSNADLTSWTGKCITKPRRGAGSRGISLLEEVPASPDPDPSMLIQEYLPGAEYSVDVLADRQGRVLSAVPRERLKVDSGVAVAARVVRDAELEHFATLAVERLGLPFISNVQFRRNSMGVPCLLEINPRTPGTMPLTVASGVNMPLLALRALLGHVTDAEVPAFKEVATVRYWTERFITPDEMSALTVQSEVAA
ncbi:MAG: ATP-grasp domain-containing protein, partial [Rhodothermales bacterium]|nr:ATP-grasp domain-containing protein [Rhodothermales bacterium]